jgi:AcrR family transcriptional regulator
MGSRVGLDKTAVVNAAVELADAGGLEAVTMGKLAERLGVRTPSLYHYLPQGIEGLRRELALQSWHDQIDLLGQAIMGKSGRDAITAMASLYREYIKAHPGLYAATTMKSTDGGDADLQTARERLYGIVQRAMSAYHLAPDDEVYAIRSFRIIVHGTASLELGDGFGLPQDVDETFKRMLNVYLSELEEIARAR